MMTREAREWMEKVERGQMSYEDAMSEFVNIARYLTRDEIQFMQNKLTNCNTNLRVY